MRPVALMDADGVLLNFSRAYLDVVEEITGSKHDISEITEWDMHKCPFFVELTKETPGLKGLVETKILAEDFCYDIPVLPGAQEGLAALHEVAEVYIVTSPYPGSSFWMPERTQALRRHFGIKHTHVIHTASKHLVQGHLLLDDKIGNLITWKHGLPLLWNTHHNLNVPVEEPIVRVYSWQQVIAEAKRLA